MYRVKQIFEISTPEGSFTLTRGEVIELDKAEVLPLLNDMLIEPVQQEKAAEARGANSEAPDAHHEAIKPFAEENAGRYDRLLEKARKIFKEAGKDNIPIARISKRNERCDGFLEWVKELFPDECKSKLCMIERGMYYLGLIGNDLDKEDWERVSRCLEDFDNMYEGAKNRIEFRKYGEFPPGWIPF